MRAATRPSGIVRGTCALATLALVALGVGARHAEGEGLAHHGPAHAPFEVVASATHAAAPVHFDAASAAVSRICLACATAVRKGAAPPAPPALVAAAAASPQPSGTTTAAPRRLDLPLPPGRSPPAC